MKNLKKTIVNVDDVETRIPHTLLFTMNDANVKI